MNVSKLTQIDAAKLSKWANPLSTFKNPDKILPILLIESLVTGGRTHEAQKRGGRIEATERFVEQGASAVVWLWGVKTLNKVGDFIGKNIMGLKDLDIDIGEDSLRRPFKDLVKDKKTATAAFKFGKIFGSAAISTVFIGFVLPKITQKITEDSIKRDEKKKKAREQAQAKDNTANGKKQDAQTVSFKSSAAFMDKLLTVSNNLENNRTWRLLSNDVGVVTGRSVNARNKHERHEFLFRDISSIYFYMFFTDHLAGILNGITRNKNIHPKALLKTAQLLGTNLGSEGLSVDEFAKQALGGANNDTVENLFKDSKDKIITLDDFIRSTTGKIGDNTIEKAGKMASLQPQREGRSVLTQMQARDVLSNSWTSSPDFLKETLNLATDGKANNPRKFTSRKSLENIRDSIDNFTQSVCDYARRHNIERVDAGLIQKLAKRNLVLSSVFTGLGIVLSGCILAFAIPKIQYYITKKATGKDEFPGVAHYDDEDNKKL